jgi:DNA-binding transcriptional regulator YiaG
MKFVELLQRAGIVKSELARRLGVSANAVSRWGDNPPKYAVVYLELLVEYNRVRP